MNAKQLFDAHNYFRSLCEANIFAQKEDFHFCTCSGIESMQEPLQQFRSKSSFFCVDDTTDSAVFRGRGGGHYTRRVFTVFLLRRYRFDDMADRQKQLNICRELFHQLMSKMIVDEDDLKNELIYLKSDNVMSRELGQYFLSGCTGLYFMVEVSEPIDLVFDESQWQK